MAYTRYSYAVARKNTPHILTTGVKTLEIFLYVQNVLNRAKIKENVLKRDKKRSCHEVPTTTDTVRVADEGVK